MARKEGDRRLGGQARHAWGLSTAPCRLALLCLLLLAVILAFSQTTSFQHSWGHHGATNVTLLTVLVHPSSGAHGFNSSSQRTRSQQPHQEQPQHPQHRLHHPVAIAGPPFIFPRLIHQTVKDKGKLSCEEIENLQTWRTLNPGYHHLVYDDADMDAFVARFFPDLLDLFRAFQKPVERADMWRYLVLAVLGGVYADADVRCIRPIKDWNKEHNHDAAVLTGLEFDDRWAVNQWVFASMPGHPLFARMATLIPRNVQREFFQAVKSSHQGKAYNYDEHIMARTGPGAWGENVEQYLKQQGADMDKLIGHGGLVGDVRVVQVASLSRGWNEQCDFVAQSTDALVCHRYYGTWKKRFSKRPVLTYGCPQVFEHEAVSFKDITRQGPSLPP